MNGSHAPVVPVPDVEDGGGSLDAGQGVGNAVSEYTVELKHMEGVRWIERMLQQRSGGRRPQTAPMSRWGGVFGLRKRGISVAHAWHT